MRLESNYSVVEIPITVKYAENCMAWGVIEKTWGHCGHDLYLCVSFFVYKIGIWINCRFVKLAGYN